MRPLTPIELFVIEKVKEERLKRSISKDGLSVKMGLSKKFVSKVENPNQPEKYNLNHLDKISEIFACSICTFFPKKDLASLDGIEDSVAN